MLRWIAEQVSADPSSLQGYAERDQTRREHFIELLNEYGWRSFGLYEHRELSTWLMNQADATADTLYAAYQAHPGYFTTRSGHTPASLQSFRDTYLLYGISIPLEL